MVSHLRDTIVAPATPPGKSAVALVRISGPKAFSVVHALTRKKPASIRSHRVQFSPLFNAQKKKIDEALVWAMKGPKTYTGEDTVEISTHGNIIIVHQVIEAAIKAGARLAHKGEFTKRAFLAGKLDLTQAEAISQVIEAQASSTLSAALLHLEGVLSKDIRTIRDQLLQLLARIEAAIDFPDEIEELSPKGVLRPVASALGHIERLLDTSRQGQLLKDGVKVVIAGAPNVGKSSLLNHLTGEQSAIVTDVPGTTRDALEEVITIKGVPVRLVDTAGLRHSEDIVERIGIERTLAHVETADVVLFLVDATRPVSEEETKKIEDLRARGLVVLVAGNKADLVPGRNGPDIADVLVSAKTGVGMSVLGTELLRIAGWKERTTGTSPLLMELRHKERLLAAHSSLKRVQNALHDRTPPDLISIDVKDAVIALGEITGETVSEEVIDHIFENFCVGK